MRAVVTILCAFMLGIPATRAAGADTSSLFDRPLHEEHAPLPVDPANPNMKPELSCYYYPHWMVKQVDLGEKGAETLSITYIAKPGVEPACVRQDQHSQEEVVIDGRVWSGYFKGVKGDYVFFDADDALHGGAGFAVFTGTNPGRVYEDVATEIDALTLAPLVGKVDRSTWNETPITLRYERAYLAPCSLRSDKRACWDVVRQATGLTDKSPPNCDAAYQAEIKRASPAWKKSVDVDPSVITYEVEAVLDFSTVIRAGPVSTVHEYYPAE